MTYKVINDSGQDGVISISGSWKTIYPGSVLYFDSKPGYSTENIRIIPVAKKTTVSTVKSTNTTKKTVYDKSTSEESK